MKRLLSAATVLLLAVLAHAQSVDSLVYEALQNNPQVRALHFQAQASEFRARSAGSLPPPAIGLELGQIPTTTGNLWNGAVANTFSISQMFMLGGKLSTMSEVEKLKGKVVDENIGALEVQLRARVKTTYLQLWLVDRQIEAQERTRSLLNDLVLAMQSRVLTNRLPQADLYAVQVELATAQAKLRELQATRAGHLSSMNALLGREDQMTAVKTDSVILRQRLRMSGEELAERLRQDNPSLRAMDRMKEMNEAEIEATRRELYPDIMVQAMLMRMPNGMTLTAGPRSSEMIQQSAAGMAMPRTDWMYGLMASITLPFVPWSASRTSGRSDELRSTVLALEAQKSSMRNEMLASLRSALIKFATADSLVRQYEVEILPLARRSAEAQMVAYTTGQVPVSSVLDSRRMEVMRHYDYRMAVADRQMALVDIELMVGRPLD